VRCNEALWRNVDDMYKYAKDNNLYLLSNFNADFWNDYVANHTDYDRMFRNMFKSYRYYDQDAYSLDDSANGVDEVTDNFIFSVKMYLMANEKRFNELYRIKVLDTSTISVTNDYKIVETMDGTKTYDGTVTEGLRSDTKTTSIGARSDSQNSTIGAKEDSTTNQKEGFNSSDFSDDNKSVNNYGTQQNSLTNNIGAQSNSETLNKGQQVDLDNHTEDNDYTLTKEGSLGNPYDNITKFQKVWNNFEFITYIFKQIGEELLLI